MVAQKKLKVFLSTGMSTLNEVKKTINILIKYGLSKRNILVMHCNTDYPTNISEVNLKAMITMQKKFNCKIGYSDHTKGFETAIAAVALGATVIEKHITLNRKLIGPDHIASMEPKEFTSYVKLIRNTSLLLGSGTKKITPSEKKNMKFVKKSIVAKTDIKKGDIFSDKNITTKRPIGGISPYMWNRVIGKKARKAFRVDDFIIL